MCSVKEPDDIRSCEDLQLLVTDTILEQDSFYSFNCIKSRVMFIAKDAKIYQNINVEAIVNDVIHDTLSVFFNLKRIAVLENNMKNIY